MTMKRVGIILKASIVLASLLITASASAELTLHSKDGVLRVWGAATQDDVAALQAKLVPGVKVLALGDIADGSWELGRALGAVVKQSNVATVVHGSCAGWVCSMMFLSGNERTFSAVSRAEATRLEIPFVQGGDDDLLKGVSATQMTAWLMQQTGLKAPDLQVYHKAAWVVSHEPVVDRLVFFVQTAKFAMGNVLHCSGELSRERKRDYMLVDCMPVKDVTALNRRVVTTSVLFSHAFLVASPDIETPAPTHYARIIDPVGDRLGLRDDCRMIYERFLDYDSPRAYAISDDGHCASTSAQVRRPYYSALAACKRLSKTGNCRFYAVDEDIVFVPFPQTAVQGEDKSSK